MGLVVSSKECHVVVVRAYESDGTHTEDPASDNDYTVDPRYQIHFRSNSFRENSIFCYSCDL